MNHRDELTFLQLKLCLLLAGIMCGDCQQSLDVSQKCFQAVLWLSLVLATCTLWCDRTAANAVHRLHKVITTIATISYT